MFDRVRHMRKRVGAPSFPLSFHPGHTCLRTTLVPPSGPLASCPLYSILLCALRAHPFPFQSFGFCDDMSSCARSCLLVARKETWHRERDRETKGQLYTTWQKDESRWQEIKEEMKRQETGDKTRWVALAGSKKEAPRSTTSAQKDGREILHPSVLYVASRLV